jgi:hypothetical protein
MTDPFAPVAMEPSLIMVGDTGSWTISDDYSPVDYTLAYAFVQDGIVRQLSGVFTNGLWTFTATNAFSSQFVAGQVTADLVVTRISDGARVTVRSIVVDFFSTSADRRSHARIMVEKIESILSGRADSDVESYTIKSRSITKMSVKELTQWREYYLVEAGREVDPFTGKRKQANTIKVGFP